MPTRLRVLSLPPLPQPAAAAPRTEGARPELGGARLEDLEAELEALLAAEAAPDGSLALPSWGEEAFTEGEPGQPDRDPFLSALQVRAEMLREQLQRGGRAGAPSGAVREELASIEALLEHLLPGELV
ncbi:MAG: hypothetical protein VKK62_11655 [Synechococcaceae cyanobacterium]|nr:hypothetical protein [Synechococcaceae cyanobacterium]